MKKHIILLSLLAFCACHSTNPDFIALEEALQTPGTTIIGMGTDESAFVRIPATAKILKIASNEKNAKFWTPLQSGDITDYAMAGTCLINARVDYIGNCPYRIYCGPQAALIAAIATNTPYAVEICK
ncbi:MAG: hypothetical protein NC311_02115 [Muribaculaceae bacterium]|nr:hypothetical protein [Muribaculaceae bacterium]